MLTERQRLILQAIVDNYIRSAEPVGSRTIAKHTDIAFSPATIRNEMADLEEMGYLEQPHTSAGRVPSHKGYRYYVDNLLQPEQVEPSYVEKIREIFRQKYLEIEQSIRQVAISLSELTHYTAFILGPEIYQTRLRQIEFIALGEKKGVFILVTDTGKVEHKLVTIPEGVPTEQIEKLVNLVNHRLRGVAIANLQRRLLTELAEEMRKHLNHYEELIQLLNKVFAVDQEDRIYLSGKSQILSQPEFRDLEKVKNLFQLLEQSDEMIRLFNSQQKGITVKIGTENNNEVINECSIVTATYEIDGKVVGSIGILGPTRMDYGKVIGILNFISRDLTRILSQFFSGK